MRCAALAAVAALALAPAARGADLFVDAALGGDANAGLSWGAPKATVLAALADASLTPEPDVVSVATGVYLGDIDVPRDVTLLGGYASGGATRDIAAYRTTLMGEGDGPVVTFGTGTDACVLDGFVVTGGWSDSASYDRTDPDIRYVGGIAIVDASPVIRNCLVQGNEGVIGGGIYAIGSAGLIEDSVIQGNIGTPVNAKVRSWLQVGQVALRRTIVRRNRTLGVLYLGRLWSTSGGMYLTLPGTGTRTVIDGCVVVANEGVGEADPSSFKADALWLSSRALSQERWTVRDTTFGTTGNSAFILETLTLRWHETVGWDFDNCLVTGPRDTWIMADSDGGWSRFMNCTLADGPGLVLHAGSVDGGSDMSFDRCILGSTGVGGRANPVFSNTLVMDGTPFGTNVINADPLFVSGPARDYYLSDVTSGQAATSPAIDQGPITSAEAGLGGCTTRTDGGADTGLVDWGYHDCGIVAGGPWADEPVAPTLEIWRGNTANALELHLVTTRLPRVDQPNIAPDTVRAGALLFYDVRGAIAPIHVARTPENASVVLTY